MVSAAAADVNYQAIARRCEKSRAEATKELAQDVLPCAGGFACYAGKGGFANRASGIGLEPATEEELDALIAFYESRDVDPVVELSPYVDDALVASLTRRGFVMKQMVNVLHIALADWKKSPEHDRHHSHDDVTIERVLDKSDRALSREIIEANEKNFVHLDPTLSPEVTVELAMKAMLSPTTDAFYARSTKENREIVAVGMAGSREGLTTLFGATTNKEFRGRGIQRALMVKRLEVAIERGSDHAVVLTSPGRTTEHNAIALGFRMAYTHVALRRPRQKPAHDSV